MSLISDPHRITETHMRDSETYSQVYMRARGHDAPYVTIYIGYYEQRWELLMDHIHTTSDIYSYHNYYAVPVPAGWIIV